MHPINSFLVAVLPLSISAFHVSPPERASTGRGVYNADTRRFNHPSHRSTVLDAHQTSGKRGATDHISENVSYGIYVHIPFCRRRCNYCDFAIVPIGKDSSTNTGFDKMNSEYTDALLTELYMIAATAPSKIPIRSIYFGGGTPSLSPLSTLQTIMNAIYKNEDSPFRLEEDAEVTIEMDPGTFDLSKLRAVKEMGFNRISLGVQSLDDSILETLGRVHRSADVYTSIDMIQQVYGDEDAHYSIDLISGVPGLSLAVWTETLYRAVNLQPRPLHISLYDLQVEQGTAFGKWYNRDDAPDDEPTYAVSTKGISTKQPALPSTEECAWMYRYASGYLRSRNYEHYEISSYAYNNSSGHTSHRSKHNQIYWEMGGQWYAVGLGATSNLGGVRFARPRALSDYISWTQEIKKANKMPWLLPNETLECEVSETDELLDIIMTRLRTCDGLDLDWVICQEQFNESHVDAILQGFQLALELNLGTRDTTEGKKYGIIRLSDPDGFLFSNNIISNIFMELDYIMQSE